MPRLDYVQSLSRGLEILEVINRNGEMGISEVSEALKMDRSTVYRLISTLKAREYLKQNNANSRYYCSLKMFEMGCRVVTKLGMGRQVRYIMEELAVSVGESVNLGVLDGSDIVHIEKIESHETIKVDVGVGERMPSYSTSLGKAILAFLPQDQVSALLEKMIFEKITPNTVTDPKLLLEKLGEVRRCGFAIDDEEFALGLKCLAAPVKDWSGSVVAAVSVAYPKYRYQVDAEWEQKLINEVLATAGKISTAFGFSGNPRAY
jgi:IclR family KDG regulon transcriptional repressor